MEHRWWHWSRIRIVEIRRSWGSQILVRERSTSSWQLFCHVTQITMVNVDVKGWHGSCNGNDNEKSDRVGSTRRREPIRLRGLGCCRAPIVRSKTVVWGTFHIHCPPAQTAIVAIIIVFVIDTQYIKRFEEISVLYLLGLHARLKIGTFKMYLSLLLLHDSGCMFSSLSWEQKFWAPRCNCGPNENENLKQSPRIIYHLLLSQTASCSLQLTKAILSHSSSSNFSHRRQTFQTRLLG